MKAQLNVCCLGGLLLVVASGIVGAQSASVRPDLGSAKMIENWVIDGNGEWRVLDGKLALIKGGTAIAGDVHRLMAIAVLKTDPFVRVTVDTELRLTAPLDSTRRDMAVIFGYESPMRFYYAHFGGITDAGNNGIFLVDRADRRRIDPPTPPPLLKDQNWHHVRVERDGATGKTEVYFDDSATPVYSVVDTTIRSGRVGLGSLNDYGEFRNIVITGTGK